MRDRQSREGESVQSCIENKQQNRNEGGKEGEGSIALLLPFAIEWGGLHGIEGRVQ